MAAHEDHVRAARSIPAVARITPESLKSFVHLKEIVHFFRCLGSTRQFKLRTSSQSFQGTVSKTATPSSTLAWKRQQPDRLHGLLPEIQNQDLVLTVLLVPSSLDIGTPVSFSKRGTFEGKEDIVSDRWRFDAT